MGMTVSAEPAPGLMIAAAEEEMAGDSGPGRGGPPSEEKREQIRKKVEAIRMWRLTEELKLDDKTSTRLASFLSSIEEKRRGLLRSTMETTRDLRTLLSASTPDQGQLRSALDKIEKNQRELVELRVKEMTGLKGMLSVEQQARYVVFQQEFRREMRGMIAGARGNGPGQGVPGMGPPGRGEGPGRRK
jgi:Spy/CpxP family protein refolding chaperone